MIYYFKLTFKIFDMKRFYILYLFCFLFTVFNTACEDEEIPEEFQEEYNEAIAEMGDEQEASNNGNDNNPQQEKEPEEPIEEVKKNDREYCDDSLFCVGDPTQDDNADDMQDDTGGDMGGDTGGDMGGDTTNVPDDIEPLGEGGVVYFVDGTTQIVKNFNPSVDKIDLGTDSIHTQILIDTPDGVSFQNFYQWDKVLLLQGVYLKDLTVANFSPIADAHLQQDLSAALAYDDGSGLVRKNTVYLRSHQQDLEEVVDFDPSTDKVSFFYLSVRGDAQTNYAVEETSQGVRFYSPATGQSLTLSGVSLSDLTSEHFEWRASQLEDTVHSRMGLDKAVPGFSIENCTVFSGKSVAMAGLVDRAPYHSGQAEIYTGTPRGQ